MTSAIGQEDESEMVLVFNNADQYDLLHQLADGSLEDIRKAEIVLAASLWLPVVRNYDDTKAAEARGLWLSRWATRTMFQCNCDMDDRVVVIGRSTDYGLPENHQKKRRDVVMRRGDLRILSEYLVCAAGRDINIKFGRHEELTELQCVLANNYRRKNERIIENDMYEAAVKWKWLPGLAPSARPIGQLADMYVKAQSDWVRFRPDRIVAPVLAKPYQISYLLRYLICAYAFAKEEARSAAYPSGEYSLVSAMKLLRDGDALNVALHSGYTYVRCDEFELLAQLRMKGVGLVQSDNHDLLEAEALLCNDPECKIHSCVTRIDELRLIPVMAQINYDVAKKYAEAVNNWKSVLATCPWRESALQVDYEMHEATLRSYICAIDNCLRATYVSRFSETSNHRIGNSSKCFYEQMYYWALMNNEDGALELKRQMGKPDPLHAKLEDAINTRIQEQKEASMDLDEIEDRIKDAIESYKSNAMQHGWFDLGDGPSCLAFVRDYLTTCLANEYTKDGVASFLFTLKEPDCQIRSPIARCLCAAESAWKLSQIHGPKAFKQGQKRSLPSREEYVRAFLLSCRFDPQHAEGADVPEELRLPDAFSRHVIGLFADGVDDSVIAETVDIDSDVASQRPHSKLIDMHAGIHPRKCIFDAKDPSKTDPFVDFILNDVLERAGESDFLSEPETDKLRKDDNSLYDVHEVMKRYITGDVKGNPNKSLSKNYKPTNRSELRKDDGGLTNFTSAIGLLMPIASGKAWDVCRLTWVNLISSQKYAGVSPITDERGDLLLPADDLVFILDSLGPNFEVLEIKKRILGLGPTLEPVAEASRDGVLKIVRYVLYGVVTEAPTPAVAEANC